MKSFIRFAIAAIVMLSVAFMSTNHVWAANPAQTTGGAGSFKVGAGLWFAYFPNGALPQGHTASMTYSNIPSDVPSYPDTGHRLHILSQATLTASTSNVGMHLVCFQTPASGGAIFYSAIVGFVDPWIPLANFQSYPIFDGVQYTCVNTWYMGTFAFGYIVP
jgi:hypothetical protein